MQAQLSHLIAQSTTDAFVAIDPDYKVIYWNRGAAQLFGWREEEIMGQSLDLILPDIHRSNQRDGVQRHSDGHEPRLVGKMSKVTALNREGRSVAIELAWTPWLDPVTGKPAGYAAVMRDISERLKLQAQRDSWKRKLEEQFAAIESAYDGIAITDPDGFFSYLNQAHCAMFGYRDAAALIGRHWSILYPADETKRIEEVAMPSVFETGSWRGETRGVHRDGRIIEQEVSLAKSPGGGLVCTTRDMGERKQAIRERIRARERLLLAERQELISRALTGVAHDFANLIAVISVASTALASKIQSPPLELELIEDAAKQAGAMLETILAPNRPAQTDRVLDAKSALAAVVELTAVTLKPQHSIRLQVPEEDIALQAPGTEFQRVMLNLCSNARDALPADRAGSIEITLEKLHPKRPLAKRVVGLVPEQPSALISVMDTGCGIAEEDLASIFEPFHTTKSFGTGLGLPVVSDVVARAGGSIHVQTGTFGTMFQIVWPLAPEGMAESQDQQETSSPVLAGARILIVDDNPSVLKLIASEVRKTGAEGVPVFGPLQALAMLEADQSGWDAVILDYDLSEMNGAQLAARIRKKRPKLPIILCTALHDKEMDVTGSLFDERVKKSTIASSLNRALDRLLSGSKVRVS
jgi:PAS domain S-box-containing protein